MYFLSQESVRHKRGSWPQWGCALYMWILLAFAIMSMADSVLRAAVSSEGDAAWWPAGSERSAHIRPRAPLIPIIHKVSHRDWYPPPARPAVSFICVPGFSVAIRKEWEVPAHTNTQSVRLHTELSQTMLAARLSCLTRVLSLPEFTRKRVKLLSQQLPT